MSRAAHGKGTQMQRHPPVSRKKRAPVHVPTAVIEQIKKSIDDLMWMFRCAPWDSKRRENEFIEAMMLKMDPKVHNENDEIM